MFTKKELDTTIDLCEAKIHETLHNEKGNDLDYIRNLQTLVTLKNTAENKLPTAFKGKTP